MYSWSSYHAWACVVTEELDFHFGTHFNRLKQPRCLSTTEVHHVEVWRLVYFFCITRAVLSQNRPENDLWTVISTSNQFQWMGFQWRIYTSDGQSFSAVLFFTFVLLRSLSLSLRTIFIDHYQRRTPCWKIGHAVEVLQQQRGLCEQTHMWAEAAQQHSGHVPLMHVILSAC